jgi:hypothetical protein
MSVTNLQIAVKIEGADEAASKLQRVENAADEVGKKSEKAGGLLAGFESGVKKLDDAVDKVERPMRTFSGALDIASLALGVGLAGPLGQVISQLIEFGGVALDAARSAGIFARSSEEIANNIRDVGKAATSSQEDVTKFYAAIAAGAQGQGATLEQRALIERTGVSLGGLRKELADLQQGITEAIATQAEARRIIASTTEDLTRQVGPVRSRAEGERLRQERQVAQDELQRAIGLEQTFRSSAINRQDTIDRLTRQTTEALGAQASAQKAVTAAKVEDVKVTERATRATRENTEAIQAEIERLKQAEFDRVAAKVIAEERAAIERERSSTPLALAEGLPVQGPTLQEALGDVIGPNAPAAKTISPLEESLKSLSESAMNLESMGVGALQSFSQAAGQALASLVIDGDKAAGSFKKLAGQVAAGLSAQAFGYAVFLTALGVAATLAPVALGALNPGGLFAGAAAMAGTGLLLGVTARALGASTYGPGQSSQSASGSAGGAQDRVSSFSAGGGGAQPMQVTVVLGVDEVSNVLVRQSQRESRAGSLSSSRLAVV